MSDAKITEDSVVSLHYKLRSESGELLDSSEGNQPIEFLQGSGEIIHGLEEHLYGMQVGESKEVTLKPEEAYGQRDPQATTRVPRSAFPDDVELKVGMAVQMRDEDGEPVLAYVGEIGEQEVLLDHNHPLAGKTLRFDVEVVGVRQATEEELQHGHAHSEGNHH